MAPDRAETSLERESTEPENRLAWIALCCGLASFVPLVILITFLPAVILGFVALARGATKPGFPGREPALLGILFALIALAIQLAVAGLASIIGLLG